MLLPVLRDGRGMSLYCCPSSRWGQAATVSIASAKTTAVSTGARRSCKRWGRSRKEADTNSCPQWTSQETCKIYSTVNGIASVSYVKNRDKAGLYADETGHCCKKLKDCKSWSVFSLSQQMFIEHLLCASSVQSTDDVSGNQKAKAWSLLCSYGDRWEVMGEIVR